MLLPARRDEIAQYDARHTALALEVAVSSHHRLRSKGPQRLTVKDQRVHEVDEPPPRLDLSDPSACDVLQIREDLSDDCLYVLSVWVDHCLLVQISEICALQAGRTVRLYEPNHNCAELIPDKAAIWDSEGSEQVWKIALQRPDESAGWACDCSTLLCGVQRFTALQSKELLGDLLLGCLMDLCDGDDAELEDILGVNRELGEPLATELSETRDFRVSRKRDFIIEVPPDGGEALLPIDDLQQELPTRRIPSQVDLGNVESAQQ